MSQNQERFQVEIEGAKIQLSFSSSPEKENALSAIERILYSSESLHTAGEN